MVWKRVVDQLKDLGQGATRWMAAGVQGVRDAAGRLPLLGSAETSDLFEDKQFDEKHYFVIPYRLAETEFLLYSMRCLPPDAPPINDLPKRRVFHMPHDNAAPLVESLLRESARDGVDTAADPAGMSGTLNTLADKIDSLDKRVFNGFLLVGGLVALANPIAGATVAAHAVVPSLATMMSTFGLKLLGRKLDDRELRAKIQRAENDVLKQFRAADTVAIVNPVLQQLQLALNTSQHEFDPAWDFDLESASFGDLDRQRMRQLTRKAIVGAYADVLEDESQWQQTCLQPEDVRWLRLLADG